MLIQIYKYEDTDKFFELVDEDEEEGYFDEFDVDEEEQAEIQVVEQEVETLVATEMLIRKEKLELAEKKKLA